MRSAKPGRSTSAAEVTNVSPHGLWLLVDGEERFLAFRDFPWFAEATIAQLSKLERPLPHHLYWPDLDIDLHLDSIAEPAAFPLVSRGESKPPSETSKPRRPKRSGR